MKENPGISGSWPGEVRLTLGTGAIAALALASWNLLYAELASGLYRDDPRRAVELFVLSALLYAPLVLVPLLGFLLVLAVSTRRPPAGGAPVDPADRVASHAGRATAVAAGLVAIGLLASRGPRLFLGSRLTWLDGSIAAAVAIACGVAARRVMLALARVPMVARLARSRMSTPPKNGRRLAALAAVTLTIVAGVAAYRSGWLATNGGTPVADRGGRPNVVFIVADALRADHVGAYGAARTRTPALDALAARGTRVERAYASASWTGPATASLLTGLSPGAHGLLTPRDHLLAEATSVASIFREAGYATAGLAANPVLSPKLGFGAGFDLWDEDLAPSRLDRHGIAPIHATLVGLHLWKPPDEFPGGEVIVRRALSWLDGRGHEPFFLYLHFMDPHDPYTPPPPFDTMYAAPDQPRLRMGLDTLPAMMEGRTPVEGRDLGRLLALYDGAITCMDGQIGRLLEGIEARGLARNTLVVFTSDHGEEFDDHAGLGHERTIYEELVRVPLIFAGPGVAGGATIASPVGSIDVAPTILESAGLRFAKAVEGRSLWGALSSGEKASPRPVFMEESYVGTRSPFHRFIGVRLGDLKLIGSSFHVEGRGPWRWELYDLSQDPAERRDLAATRQDEVEAMRAQVEAWARRAGNGVPGRAAPGGETGSEPRSPGSIP